MQSFQDKDVRSGNTRGRMDNGGREKREANKPVISVGNWSSS